VIVALVLLLLGVVAARLPAVPERTPATLDVLVLWFALPGLILVEVPRLQLGVETLVPVAVAWGTTLLAIVVVLVLGRLRGWSRRTIGTMLLVVPLGNTSFLGIPAVSALLGSSHLGQALVYDQVGNFVAFVTWGTFVAARYGDGGTPTLGGTVRRILVFPPFVALLVALVIREGLLTGTVLAVVNDVAGALGATLIPLTMLAIGMRLDLPRRWTTFEPMMAGLVVRMGLAPAAAYGALVLLDGGGIAWEASILQASMPPMVTAAIVATAAGLDEELATSLVGVGVLAAFLTAPAWAGLIT
jgi:malate permease and related proteins